MDTVDGCEVQEDEYEELMILKGQDKNAGAWASLILGIVGSLGWLAPVIGLPVTIVGTVLGAVGMKNKENQGIAIAGFIINTVFVVCSVAKGIIDIVFYLKKSKKA